MNGKQCDFDKEHFSIQVGVKVIVLFYVGFRLFHYIIVGSCCYSIPFYTQEYEEKPLSDLSLYKSAPLPRN